MMIEPFSNAGLNGRARTHGRSLDTQGRLGRLGRSQVKFVQLSN